MHLIDDPGNPNISGSGHFLLGAPAVFFFDFPDIDGVLYDPSDINVTITDPEGTVVKTCDSLDRLETGRYVLEWTIPSDLLTGKYTLTLTFVAETDDGPVNRSHVEYFVISESETAYFDQYAAGMIAVLEAFIGESQRIPVYDEIGRLSLDRTVASFSFERWNQPAGCIIHINGKLNELAHTVDYNKGKIYFTVPLSTVDEVTATYNFRYFTDSELLAFITQAVMIFNQHPPQNSFLPATLPDRFRITVVLQAAVFSIRRLLMDILYQKPAKIFGGMDRADKVFSSLDQLKKNYEDQLKELYQAKLKQPYIGLTKTVSTPEYTLPGGRCFAHDTLVIIRENNDVFETTVHDLYMRYELENNDLYIQSHDDENNIITFEKINKVWFSEEKVVYNLVTEHGLAVKTSSEHLFFVPELGYIPLQQLEKGDSLITVVDGTIKTDKIKSISQYGHEKTYDIEVSRTNNLFANGIKCHNSRWFRYLFKGGM